MCGLLILKHMLNQLDRTFQALGDPTRRALVERLTAGPASVSELAAVRALSPAKPPKLAFGRGAA